MAAPFIQSEINKYHRCHVRLRCFLPDGRPAAGCLISLQSQEPAFTLGASWPTFQEGVNTAGLLRQLPRLVQEILIPVPVTAQFLEACEASGLRTRVVVPSPERMSSLSEWAGHYFSLPFRNHTSKLSGVAVDLGAGGTPQLVTEAIQWVRSEIGLKVTVMGLPLEDPRLPLVEADEWGVDLSLHTGSSRPYPMAFLRRRLLNISERLGRFFVYGVHARDLPAGFLPRSQRIGGQERVCSDYLVELAAICFSVPGVTGTFFDQPVGRKDPHSYESLLTPRLHPTRSFKMLRSLCQHEWSSYRTGLTDATGEFACVVFEGSYRLSLALPGCPTFIDSIVTI